jgi:glycosyltransferase involved in cell wall biosynthesis
MGRLDRQKGIDRLHDAIVKLKEQGIPFEAQAIGGEILSDDPSASWMTRLKDAGVKVSPPVFDGKDIANHLAWADVLLMPSRWEGAPLMIAGKHSSLLRTVATPLVPSTSSSITVATAFSSATAMMRRLSPT